MATSCAGSRTQPAPDPDLTRTGPGVLELLEPPRDLGIDADHGRRVAVGRVRYGEASHLALVLKMRKADAQRMSGTLVDMTGMSAVQDHDSVRVCGWAGPDALGTLCRIDQRVPELLRREIRALVLSGGGSKRAFYWSHELVWHADVSIHPPIPRVACGSGWPDPSATLDRFVGPLKPAEMPLPVAQELCRMGARLWSAVVLADGFGRTEVLQATSRLVCRRGAPTGLVDFLIERKRRNFPSDPRLLWLEAPATHPLGGEAGQVSAALPRADALTGF